jgi:iron complex outermembrane receptor protein
MRMLRSKLLVFSLLFLTGKLWAAVEGVVQREDGRGVAFAKVSVLGEPGWVVADAQGRFLLARVPAGRVTLLVAGPDGVLLGTFPFEALPDPLVLTVAPLAEAVTVTASRPPDLVVPPATAFAALSSKELELRQPAQLADALESIPNVGRLEEGHSVVPALRGMARFRSLLLLDETRVLTERRAGPSATFLDPTTVGEIEVVRGAAGVAYGSDAFGGVIAARTRLANPGDPWGVRYRFNAATGTPERAVALEAGGSLGPGALTLGLGWRDFDRYTSPKGEVYNSEASFRHLRLGYQLPWGEGLLRLLWRSDWGREIGKPALSSRTVRASYPEENAHRAVMSFEAPLAGPWKRYAWSVSWVEYQLITDRDRFATATSPRQLTRADVASHDYNARLEVERQLAGGQLLLGADAYGRFGLEATNDTYRFADPAAPTRAREVSIANARKDDLGVFAAFNRSFGAWAASLGLRGHRAIAKNRGGYFGSRSFQFTRGSGFAAVSFSPAPGWETSLQYARGFRDAVLSDRFYRGISGRGFITGNPDLKPETSKQWDLAVRYSSGRWSAALYGYRYDIEDFIERYRSGADYFFRNRATARFSGLEGELAVSLPQNVRLTVGLQLPSGKVLDDGSFLDDVPARGGFLWLSGKLSRLRWETRFAAYARDTRPGPTEAVVPGYAQWDLGASFQLAPALEIGLYARNLLDRAYVASADPDAVLAPGRSVQLSLRGFLAF